jgi:hypothetical protein
MKSGHKYLRIIQWIIALVAALFGLATLMAGGQVLAGSDPGYVVFRPLLIYNTAMGIAYLAAAVIIWRNLDKGKYMAGSIFSLNLLVLAMIGYLFASGSAVAINSLRAMTFRTVVWLVLFLGLMWISRKHHSH